VAAIALPLGVYGQTWSPLQDFPANMGRKEAVSFAVGNKIYVATGRRSGLRHNDNWEYNPKCKFVDAETTNQLRSAVGC
jgi:hypothetical protein